MPVFEVVLTQKIKLEGIVANTPGEAVTNAITRVVDESKTPFTPSVSTVKEKAEE